MRYILLFLLLCSPTVVLAQTQSLDLVLSTFPENPSPGSSFTVQAQSFGVDINLANFEWTYNGAIVARGIGKTTMTFVAPSAGTVATVKTVVSGLGFDPTVASVSIRPGSIDLVWEAVDSYVPPFYKGKALLSTGGQLRVTAIPATTAPRGLNYTWSRNGSALQKDSGYNKTSILFLNDILKNTESISVTASGGLFSGDDTVVIASKKPLVTLYQNIGGYIEYANGGSDTLSIKNKGSILHFEPYFFSTNQPTNGLIFEYKEGDEDIVADERTPNQLAVTIPKDAPQSILSVFIKTKSYSLQNVEKIFTLYFE